MSSEWQSVGRHHEAHPLGPGRPPAAAPGRAGCMGTARSVYAFKWNRLSRGQLGGPPSPPATALNGSVVSGPTRPPGPDRLPQSSRRLRRGLAAVPTARTGSARRSGERPLTGSTGPVQGLASPPTSRGACPPLGRAAIYGSAAAPTAGSSATRLSGSRPAAYLVCTRRPCLRARSVWPCLRTGKGCGPCGWPVDITEGLRALGRPVGLTAHTPAFSHHNFVGAG